MAFTNWITVIASQSLFENYTRGDQVTWLSFKCIVRDDVAGQRHANVFRDQVIGAPIVNLIHKYDSNSFLLLLFVIRIQTERYKYHHKRRQTNNFIVRKLTIRIIYIWLHRWINLRTIYRVIHWNDGYRFFIACKCDSILALELQWIPISSNRLHDSIYWFLLFNRNNCIR